MTKERLEYIDFLKGICMVLIVIWHLDSSFFNHIVLNLDNVMHSLPVLMFFFLSGLFFRMYDSFNNFIRRKVNSLIIPLLFFEVLCLVFAYIIFTIKQLYGIDSTVGFKWYFFLDPLLERDWHYTFPMWFLLSLFEANIIYYLLCRYFNTKTQVFFVIVLGVIGFILCKFGIILPLQLDATFISLPLFSLGHYVKNTNLIHPSKYDKIGLLALIPIAVFTYFTSGTIDIHFQHVPSLLQLYVIPTIAILTLFFSSKNMCYVPKSVQFIGRYSIIVLCTHALFVSIILQLSESVLGESVIASLIALVVVMLVEAFVIVILSRLFPHFTAQKEFFEDNWKPFWANRT